MKKHKKVLALIMAGLMTMSLAACSSGGEKKTEDKPAAEETEEKTDGKAGGKIVATNKDGKSKDNDLVIAIEGSVSSLDPANIPDTNAITATRGIYENLVKFDDKHQVVGQLAENFEISEDSLTYTFHLKKGVKFHDGTDFNAAAVKANYDRVVDKNNNLRTRRTFIVTNADKSETPRIESIETPDEYTVVFKLTEAYSTFINKLTQFAIISPDAIAKHGNDIMRNACGTGPYLYKEWVEGDHTTLTRNDNYWGEKAKVDTVTIKEVPEAGSRTAMLQTGEADFVYPMPSDQLGTAKDAGDITVDTVSSNIMRYVTLNQNIKELSDIKVRQAMNYAIDKDAFIKLMYEGYGVEPTSVVPSVISYYSEQKPYKFELEKAKTLMKEAGYEKGFKLTLWGDNSTQEVKGMTFVKQQLQQIGIDVEVVPMEPATVSEKINAEGSDKELNMWYVNWSASDFSADGSMRSLLHSTMAPPTSANTCFYNNSEFDKLLDDGLHTADPEELKKLYADAQKIAWDDATWLFLGNDNIIYAQKPYLSGVMMGADGCIDFAQATLAQ